MRPTDEELGLFPTRVVALPGERSAYSFTMFQAPVMPDELFESQYQSAAGAASRCFATVADP